jgi:hypothetical protein
MQLTLVKTCYLEDSRQCLEGKRNKQSNCNKKIRASIFGDFCKQTQEVEKYEVTITLRSIDDHHRFSIYCKKAVGGLLQF